MPYNPDDLLLPPKPTGATDVLPKYEAQYNTWQRNASKYVGTSRTSGLETYFPFGWELAVAEDLYELPQAWLDYLRAKVKPYAAVRTRVVNGELKSPGSLESYYLVTARAYVDGLFRGRFNARSLPPATPGNVPTTQTATQDALTGAGSDNAVSDPPPQSPGAGAGAMPEPPNPTPWLTMAAVGIAGVILYLGLRK